ncbi:MAG TPA: COX15/CtaA family protein [Polyangiaceae bacterium]|nr:COX15/CtaA family protein [Polyangiaceae bacterium]
MADALPASALSGSVLPAPNRRLPGWGFALLGYTVFVLLFGALVRVTGSGAGCGQHWPTCQGELVLMPRTFHTALEYGHRLTSGLVLVAAVAYAVALRRKLPRGHRAARAMLVGLAFTLVDAAIGAWLVLGALVGQNASAARAMVMPAHLVSTCGRSAGFALAAEWASETRPNVSSAARRWPLFACLAAFVVVAAMGAVTALGDTLYPIKSSGLALSGSHFLEQLRIVHPLLAVAFGLTVASVVPRLVQTSSPSAQRFARWVVIAVGIELAVGLLNVVLAAPAWMQLVHLGLAIALWLCLVLTTAEALAPRAS